MCAKRPLDTNRSKTSRFSSQYSLNTRRSFLINVVDVPTWPNREAKPVVFNIFSASSMPNVSKTFFAFWKTSSFSSCMFLHLAYASWNQSDFPATNTLRQSSGVGNKMHHLLFLTSIVSIYVAFNLTRYSFIVVVVVVVVVAVVLCA